MLAKTRGIVFHTIKYSETSVITKIYTEAFGLQSYIINGVRTKGSKNKSSHFQPFNILDLEIYRRENKNLQRIKEFKIGYVFRSIPFNVFKSSIALFLVEVLNKVIKEEESNENLFRYIEQSIMDLDESSSLESNFHLHFLIHLTSYLGFFPSGTFEDAKPYFDLKEGCFVSQEPPHFYFLKPVSSKQFSDLMAEPNVSLSLLERNDLLEKMLQYYELHLEGFKKIKSHTVLSEVLG